MTLASVKTFIAGVFLWDYVCFKLALTTQIVFLMQLVSGAPSAFKTFLLKVKLGSPEPTGEVFLERLETGQLVPILESLAKKSDKKTKLFGRGVANRISCTNKIISV